MVADNINDECIVIDEDDEDSSPPDQAIEEKKLLFSLEVVHEEVFEKVKDTIINALKDSLRCADIHNIIVGEEERRFNFYEKLTPADLFEEALQPSAVHVENVSYDALGSKLTDVETEGAPLVEKLSGNTTCFNCDGNHTLRECPLPRDHKRINRSRNNMANKTSSRYHLTLDNKYSKFKPGRISDELKVALGLSRKSLPIHIYRMRVCGYPVAWLKEAEIAASGLSMINTDQCAQKSKEGNALTTIVYDLDKIIEYPGFNVGCGEDFVDVSIYYGDTAAAVRYSSFSLSQESRRFNLPPMLENHSKEHFIRMLKQTAEFAKIQQEDNAKQQQQITETNLTELPDDNSGDQQLDTTAPNEDVDMDQSFDAVSCEKRSAALKTMEGTPVLNSISPFGILPKGENFSVGVSDVIAFENLPDSTGKYEKMRDTIGKVRKTLLKDLK